MKIKVWERIYYVNSNQKKTIAVTLIADKKNQNNENCQSKTGPFHKDERANIQRTNIKFKCVCKKDMKDTWSKIDRVGKRNRERQINVRDFDTLLLIERTSRFKNQQGYGRIQQCYQLAGPRWHL